MIGWFRRRKHTPTPPPTPPIRHRSRQAGKVYDLSLSVSERCGLPRETVGELILAGWTYTEYETQPARWTAPGKTRSRAGTPRIHVNVPHDRGCTRPPTGWWCSREAGHPGPCTARRGEKRPQ